MKIIAKVFKTIILIVIVELDNWIYDSAAKSIRGTAIKLAISSKAISNFEQNENTELKIR